VTCWSRSTPTRAGLLVFNKVDVADSRSRELAKLYEGSVWVSAKTGENLDE